MSSTAITIKNTLESIKSGEIPGELVNGVFKFEELEYSNKLGATLFWSISVQLVNAANEPVPITERMLDQPIEQYPGHTAILKVAAGNRKTGKIRDSAPTLVTCGKNLGKKNETNCITQAIRDALGLHNKQVKKHIVVEDIYPPMLAENITHFPLTTADFAAGVTVQNKLNGVHLVCRCINNDPSKVELYSRSCHKYEGQAHIVKEMEQIFAAILLDEIINIYFAGELYLHGKPLNWISGQSRKADDEGELEYHIFDVFDAKSDEFISLKRQEFITNTIAPLAAKTAHIKIVPGIQIKGEMESCKQQLDECLKKTLEDGYEGVIIRKDTGLYEYSYNNRHSRNLLKYKPLYDNEFEVIGFTEGKKGKDLGAIIWICKAANGAQFNVTPKNITYEQRKNLFKSLTDSPDIFPTSLLGKMMTVEYAEMSEFGIPSQAKAVAFRTYEGPDDISELINRLTNMTIKQ